VYVADGLSGIQVIAIEEITDPVFQTTLDTPGQARDIYVHGEFAFVADGDSFRTFDILFPNLPTYVGAVATPDNACSVVGIESRALVACQESGLQVVSVANPQSPQIVGELTTPGIAYDVTVHDGIVYLADGSGGLQVIDFSDPTRPDTIGWADTGGSARGVAVAPGHVALADFTTGLQIAAQQCVADLPVGPDTPPRAEVLVTAHPNPFNPRLQIDLEVYTPQTVRISVHDLAGGLVAELADRWFAAGHHNVAWHGRDAAGRAVPSGSYLIMLRGARPTEIARKVTLLR